LRRADRDEIATLLRAKLIIGRRDMQAEGVEAAMRANVDPS